MRLTSICALLALTGFTVAQTSPSVYQDFSGLFHNLTSSVDEATGKVKAQDPKNLLVLKTLVAGRNDLLRVQLDFYHLYINAVHEPEEAIHNNTEAQDVAKVFITYSDRTRVYIDTQEKKASDLLSLGAPFYGVGKAKKTLEGLKTSYDTFAKDVYVRLQSPYEEAKVSVRSTTNLTDESFTHTINRYSEIQGQCHGCNVMEL